MLKLPYDIMKNRANFINWQAYKKQTVSIKIFQCGKYNTQFTLNAPGRVAQSVTCLATDAKLTADPGVASSIPARSHTFVETDHEIISTVILLSSAE